MSEYSELYLIKDARLFKQDKTARPNANTLFVSLSDGKKMEELMPDAGLAVIEGAGHYSFLDNLYVYNKILGSFLGIKN